MRTTRHFVCLILVVVVLGIGMGVLWGLADRFDRHHPPARATDTNPMADYVQRRNLNPNDPTNPFNPPPADPANPGKTW